MKHVDAISQSACPVKFADSSLLVKQHEIELMGELIAVLGDAYDLCQTVLGKAE